MRSLPPHLCVGDRFLVWPQFQEGCYSWLTFRRFVVPRVPITYRLKDARFPIESIVIALVVFHLALLASYSKYILEPRIFGTYQIILYHSTACIYLLFKHTSGAIVVPLVLLLFPLASNLITHLDPRHY